MNRATELFRGLAAAMLALVLTSSMALAQGASPTTEITPSHLAAANETLKATHFDKGLDNLLPDLALDAQQVFLASRPDLSKEIGDAVDAMAIKLVSRRAELQSDVARVWAKNFTEAELKAISAFYTSAAGKKLTTTLPQVNNEVSLAVRNWRNRLADELVDRTREELKRRGYEFN